MKLEKMTFSELLAALSKAVGAKQGIAVVWAFLASWLIHIAPFIAVMVVMVFSDLITGIFASWKRGERVTSKGLQRTTVKITLYFVAIGLSLMVQETAQLGIDLVYWVSMYIIGTEFLSNIENISTATGTDLIGMVKEFVADKIGKKNKH